jgi:tripartite-type tricarboxylate transporter receptor subunit TctC
MAERVKDSLGTVIIDNKPGGGGNIGADIVAKAPADGLTIGIAAVATHAINPWLFSKMPYDAAKDFAPITQMLRVPNVLVMNADTAARLKINTLADLIAYAKANPAKLNYGSGGNGSAGHLAGEMFKRDAGIFAVHIPYNGGNPAQLALLRARWTSTSTTWPRPRPTSGRASSRRWPSPRWAARPRCPMCRRWPTRSRALRLTPGGAWWRPAATPRDVVARLNQAFVAALNSPEAKTRFAGLMAEPVPNTPEQFGAFMKAELAKYETVVKASGAKVD